MSKVILAITLFVLLGLLGCSQPTIQRQKQILHWQWARQFDTDCTCPVCWEAWK